MTTQVMGNGVSSVLRAACVVVGIDAAGAEALGGRTAYRLPGGTVARISGPGGKLAAIREVALARWLESYGVRAARLAPDVAQPVMVDGRAVTFWQELPPHRPATHPEIADMLERLHRLPLPGFELRRVTPLAGMEQEISAARTLGEDDRLWLRAHLDELRGRWAGLPSGRPWSVIHGDDWGGSVVVTEDGEPLLAGFGRARVGPPEWDLVQAAIECWSLSAISVEQYAEFCQAYGLDVMRWGGFFLLRDIREFRMTIDAAAAAARDPADQAQAVHRLGCLRGDAGVRPWAGWTDLE